MENQVLSFTDVANKLGYTEKTLMHYIYTGHEIKKYFRKCGRNLIMKQEDFQDYINSQEKLG